MSCMTCAQTHSNFALVFVVFFAHPHLHSTELLASHSPPPAIMWGWGGSNGPWLSFPPPLPFHFLITSPLPSLTGAQTRLSLCYSTFRSVPHFLVAPRHDPAAAGNGHLHHSFLSLAPCLSCTLCISSLPSSSHTQNRSQIISSTLSVVRQLLFLLVTCSALANVPCSTLSGPSSIIPVLHTVGVNTLLVVSAHDSHLC